MDDLKSSVLCDFEQTTVIQQIKYTFATLKLPDIQYIKTKYLNLLKNVIALI